jgi:Cu/Zn superoxide dismutase
MKDVHHLRAAIKPFANRGNKIKGFIEISEVFDGINIIGQVEGLSPGSTHSIHVLEFSDLSELEENKTSKDFLKHFNPTNVKHSCPSNEKEEDYHFGDFGNIIANNDGIGFVSITKKLSIKSFNGRIVVVNKSSDKCDESIEYDDVKDILGFGLLNTIKPNLPAPINHSSDYLMRELNTANKKEFEKRNKIEIPIKDMIPNKETPQVATNLVPVSYNNNLNKSNFDLFSFPPKVEKEEELFTYPVNVVKNDNLLSVHNPKKIDMSNEASINPTNSFFTNVHHFRPVTNLIDDISSSKIKYNKDDDINISSDSGSKILEPINTIPFINHKKQNRDFNMKFDDLNFKNENIPKKISSNENQFKFNFESTKKKDLNDNFATPFILSSNHNNESPYKHLNLNNPIGTFNTPVAREDKNNHIDTLNSKIGIDNGPIVHKDFTNFRNGIEEKPKNKYRSVIIKEPTDPFSLIEKEKKLFPQFKNSINNPKSISLSQIINRKDEDRVFYNRNKNVFEVRKI